MNYKTIVLDEVSESNVSVGVVDPFEKLKKEYEKDMEEKRMKKENGLFRRIGNWAKRNAGEIAIISAMGAVAGISGYAIYKSVVRIDQTAFNTGFVNGKKAAICEMVSDISEMDNGNEVIEKLNTDHGYRYMNDEFVEFAKNVTKEMNDYCAKREIEKAPLNHDYIVSNMIYMPAAKLRRK